MHLTKLLRRLLCRFLVLFFHLFSSFQNTDLQISTISLLPNSDIMFLLPVRLMISARIPIPDAVVWNRRQKARLHVSQFMCLLLQKDCRLQCSLSEDWHIFLFVRFVLFSVISVFFVYNGRASPQNSSALLIFVYTKLSPVFRKILISLSPLMVSMITPKYFICEFLYLFFAIQPILKKSHTAYWYGTYHLLNWNIFFGFLSYA